MTTDVLVIGSGIAGCCAAVEAARAGARVAIACAGRCFSGSSFFPGTWGLGLVGPEDAADEADLVETICRVGGGVADRALVQTFVHGILPGIDWLEHDLGLTLKRPASAASAHEAAFIPCFDHKHRLWRGLERQPAINAFSRAFARQGVTVAERRELVALLPADADGGRVSAVLFDHDTERFETVRAGSVVITTGGTSGLFERRLTARDVLSSTQGIALACGCRLVNIEFMQIMPGLIVPKRGIVFNEKSFRYARTQPPLPRDLLEQRATYGPFTSRLASRAVDFAIDAAGPAGLPLTYAFPERDVPEFVRTFTAWLEREQGISPTDELRIVHYAHASNGGIAIDADGWTGVPGVFAAGEATGGMHGADRIGGLSSANGLVFGRRAGRAAAAHALACCRDAAPRGSAADPDARQTLAAIVDAEGVTPPAVDAPTGLRLEHQMQRLMSAHAMVVRTAAGLDAAATGLAALSEELSQGSTRHATDSALASSNVSDTDLARGLRLASQLRLAAAMIDAMRARTTSLGSHFRADAKSSCLERPPVTARD